ncbi:MAG: hypothetical protein IPM54_23055 [Polyangiaceae bacterium]|nr:hypothetical protein [Polyangiaceae bacterium]
MERRAVLEAAVVLLVAPMLPREVRACDGRDGTAEACERLVARIGRNHGHVFPIGVADVMAGVEKTYDLTGTSGHKHLVTVTANDFLLVRRGERVRLPSTKEGGHIHRLMLECVPLVDPPSRINVCDIQVGGKDEHEFIITAADMAAKVEKTYDIHGLANHPHAVTFTPADFRELENGKQVSIQSSVTEGHSHFVYVKYSRKS